MAGKSLIRHFEANASGRDWVVGDIHGHFRKLQTALDRTGFDSSRDRLFSVGDLVDRGPEPEEALAWLARPWFHAVRGNHEDYAIRHALTRRVDVQNYRKNGGGWFIDLPEERQTAFALAFNRLPYAMEVATAAGLIGIVHADCPVYDWRRLPEALTLSRTRNSVIWSRTRIESGNDGYIRNIHAVIAGHTPVSDVVVLGNVMYIDTAGWTEEGCFTIMDLGDISRRTFR